MPPRVKRFHLFFILSSIFVALFPWLFTYSGTIAGVKISIRSVGDYLGVALALMGVGILFSKNLRSALSSLALELDLLLPRQRLHLAISLTVFYTLAIISHKWRAHYMLGTHTLDLGFFSNICWNTSQGRWFYSSILERNNMALHVNWILWPISVFYPTGWGTEIMLALQSIILSISVPILIAIVSRITNQFSIGLLSGLLFVSSPYVGHFVSNDFHPDIWQVPCLMAALWAWQQDRRWLTLGFAFLGLLAKEDVSFILSGFALMLFIDKRWRGPAVFLFAGAVAAFLWHTQIFIPKFIEGQDGSSLLFNRYWMLGGSYEEMVSNLFNKPIVYWQAVWYDPMKYWRLFSMTLSSLSFVFLAPTMIIPPLVSSLPHLLSQSSTQLSLADIYSMPLQPFIFVGAALGFQKVLRKKIRAPQLFILAGAVFIAAGYGVYEIPRFYRSVPMAKVKAFHQEIKTLIPPDASVAAQHNLLPHFDARRYIQFFPVRLSMPGLQTKYLSNPDYVVCDRLGNALPQNEVELWAAIEEMEKNPDYEKIFDRENFVLFKRRTVQEPIWKT